MILQLDLMGARSKAAGVHVFRWKKSRKRLQGTHLKIRDLISHLARQGGFLKFMGIKAITYGITKIVSGGEHELLKKLHLVTCRIPVSRIFSPVS